MRMINFRAIYMPLTKAALSEVEGGDYQSSMKLLAANMHDTFTEDEVVSEYAEAHFFLGHKKDETPFVHQETLSMCDGKNNLELMQEFEASFDHSAKIQGEGMILGALCIWRDSVATLMFFEPS